MLGSLLNKYIDGWFKMLERKKLLLGVLLLLVTSHTSAALLTFNSANSGENASTRDAWLSAIGITAPSFTIDFESGFTEGQNISGLSLIGGLTINDTSSAGSAAVSAGPFGGSNPVGQFALGHNEAAFLEFDFSNAPVDYFGFKDIDQGGTSGVVTFVGGATTNISFETTATSGNSAEFFGIFRNDMPKITLVQLDATGDNNWAVDDLEFGAPVPLPGAVYLLLSGIAGLVLSRPKARG